MDIFDMVLETALTTKMRDSLSDDQFGIPELRKYPLNDANHVRSAIRFFDHCPDKYKKSLANRIREAAKKYGVEISDECVINNY